MHEHQIKPGRKTTHETKTNTAGAVSTFQPSQSACRARDDSGADMEIDQDSFEPGILFRPRLYFVPE
jgi:hypothetical protein